MYRVYYDVQTLTINRRCVDIEAPTEREAIERARLMLRLEGLLSCHELGAQGKVRKAGRRVANFRTYVLK